MERDTSAASRERYHELLRAAGPETLLRAAVSLGTAVRALTLAGLRARHPSATGDELRARLAVRLYGRDTARKMFDVLPDDAV